MEQNKKILSKEEIKQREEDFQILQRDWFENGTKSSWEKMWIYVMDACSNSAKKQLKGVFTDDLDGKVLSATCDVMMKIKDGTSVNKLSSFVYWYVKGRLFEKKTQLAEKCLSYDYYVSSISEKESNYNY